MPAWVDGGRRQYHASHEPPTYEDPCFFHDAARRIVIRLLAVLGNPDFSISENLPTLAR